MPELDLFLWTAIGVLISYILPPLLRAAGVRAHGDPTASLSTFVGRLQRIVTVQALAVAALSLILAIVLLAFMGDEITDWRTALLAGLGWQSITARIFAPGT